MTDSPAVSSGLSTADESAERSRNWRTMVLVVLLSATFLNYACRFAFTQNSVRIQESLDVGEKEYGAMAGRFGIGFACGGLLFGFLADKVSVRVLYPLVVVVWSLAGMTSGLVTTVFGLGASRFVLGLFEAGHWPCAMRTTQRTFLPAERTWANSVLQSGASLGAWATPLLVVWLLGQGTEAWRLAFLITGGLGIPWALWWWLTVSESDVRRPVIQTDEHGSGEQRELVEIPFYQVFLTRRWYLLLIVVICINTLWHYVRVWMPLMLEKDHGYSPEFTGYFTSLYYLCTFAGALASGWLTMRMSRWTGNVHRGRLLTFLIFALLSSLSIPAAFLPAGRLLLGCLLVVAFGSLGLFPIYYSLNQEISARNQGKVGGTLGFSTWFLLSLMHPAIGGLVEQNPEIRPWLFATTGLGPIIAFATIALFWGQRPGDTPAAADAQTA